MAADRAGRGPRVAERRVRRQRDGARLAAGGPAPAARAAVSERGAALARLARDPNRFLATIQIGITLAGFLASAAAAVSLAEPLEEPLAFLGGAAEPVAIVLVTLVLAYLTLVLGELAPKRVAMQRAERWALLAARPLAAHARRSPARSCGCCRRSTDVAVRLMGGDPNAPARGGHRGGAPRPGRGTQASFTAEQRVIIAGAFEIAERTLRRGARPRRDVFVLDADADRRRRSTSSPLAATPAPRWRTTATSTTSSASCTCVTSLGRRRRPVSELARRGARLPRDAPTCSTRCASCRRSARQMALVVDEHGGTDGHRHGRGPARGARRRDLRRDRPRRASRAAASPTARWCCPGAFPVHDLTDIGVHRHARGPVLDGGRPGPRPARAASPTPPATGRRAPAARSTCWRSTAGPSPRSASAPRPPTHPTAAAIRPPSPRPSVTAAGLAFAGGATAVAVGRERNPGV